VEGGLVITPAAEPHANLDEFLALVTEENLHGEAATGSVVGREAW